MIAFFVLLIALCVSILGLIGPFWYAATGTTDIQANTVNALTVALIGGIIAVVSGFIVAVSNRREQARQAEQLRSEPPVEGAPWHITLATDLIARGHHNEAAILLRNSLWAWNELEDARPTLVALCRMRGHSTEAGRWGCTVDGLTTPQEREAFARALRSGQRRRVDLHNRMSALTSASPGMSDDARDVLRRAGVTVVERQPERNPDIVRRLARIRRILYSAFGVTFLAGILVSATLGALRNPETTRVARILLVASTLIGGVALQIETMQEWREHHSERHLVAGIIASILLLTPAGFVIVSTFG